MKLIDRSPKIIAVSKTFKLDHINPLIDHGHIDFGGNKVQEAVEKWTDIKKDKSELKIHLVGRLQTNKVKFALKVFDYIHSLDSKKLAVKISEEQAKHKIKPKIFIGLCHRIRVSFYSYELLCLKGTESERITANSGIINPVSRILCCPTRCAEINR